MHIVRIHPLLLMMLTIFGIYTSRFILIYRVCTCLLTYLYSVTSTYDLGYTQVRDLGNCILYVLFVPARLRLSFPAFCHAFCVPPIPVPFSR